MNTIGYQFRLDMFVLRAVHRAVHAVRNPRPAPATPGGTSVAVAPTMRPSPLLREAQRTVRVLDTLARLDREQRAPQTAELAELAAWQGWGSLTPAYGARPEA